MGVNSCDRRGCGNVMSDRYSHHYGDLCTECFNELVESGKKNIQKFMDSDKRETKDSNFRDYDYYDEIFPSRY